MWPISLLFFKRFIEMMCDIVLKIAIMILRGMYLSKVAQPLN